MNTVQDAGTRDILDGPNNPRASPDVVPGGAITGFARRVAYIGVRMPSLAASFLSPDLCSDLVSGQSLAEATVTLLRCPETVVHGTRIDATGVDARGLYPQRAMVDQPR